MNKKIIISFLLVTLLITTASGAPITGVTGSRIIVKFMYQDPDPGDAGKYLDLRWQVINTIPKKTEVLRFYLDAGYPFLFEAGDSPYKDLGPSIGTGDNEVYYVLHYKLKVADDALKGTYNVTLKWTTGDGWIEKEYPIYIDPKRADFVIGALKTSPERLIADTKEAKLSVDISNIGDGNAENVKVKLILPDLPEDEGFVPSYGYSDEDTLGNIEKDASKTATFYIDVGENVKEGEYNAKLEITYKDENDETNTYRTKTLDLKIPVKPSPYLIIENVTTSPHILKPGEKALVRVRIKNIGSEKAESVSLRVFKDASQPFKFDEKSDYVGTLSPNESGDAVLKLTIKKDAVAKTYLIDAELRGVDKRNNVVIFSRSFALTVNPETKALNSIGILSLIAFAGAVAYLRRKKG